MRPSLVLVALLAGCAAESVPVEAALEDMAASSLPLERTVIVDHELLLLGVEWDVLCSNGGGPRLERTGAWIGPRTARLEVTIELAPTYSALQVGYALDGGPVTWLPAVGPGSSRQTVEVPPSAAETAAPRWEFFYQLNLPALPQECYTGAGSGERSIRIEALPAEEAAGRPQLYQPGRVRPPP